MKIRPIAIHLPQFHPIPENDSWWGKGFTEWTNVTKAKPLFKGHYQPKLPADLGFYDLRLEEARIAQAELAKQYGIYGFCYYHYWFNGKTLLEQPIEEILKTGKPDFPFMLCWANEHWTRVWDGGESNILIEQTYSAEDDVVHVKYLMQFFKDPRYIRIDNKPVFAIYRSDLLPDVTETVKLWQNIAALEGIELYILRFESQGVTGQQYMKEGIDAAAEFQPHAGIELMRSDIEGLRHKLNRRTLRNAYFRRKKIAYEKLGIKFEKDEIYEYGDFVECEIKNLVSPASYKLFRSVCPSFDNSSRKVKNYVILKNATPALFDKWIKAELKHFTPYTPEENLFFINAWNEWAEGNYLEPDIRWGDSFLKIISQNFSLL